MQVRHIDPKMIAYLDSRLATNGLAQYALQRKDARTLMVEAAKTCVGFREKTGHNDGPMIELLQKTIGIAEGESYCMGGVQTMIAYAEFKTGIKSTIYVSEGVTDVWTNTPAKWRVKFNPLPGALMMWQHKGSWRGHTGIVLGADEKRVPAVEFNTTFGIIGSKIIREGGGVYYTDRSRFGDGDMIVLGQLIPFPPMAA